jgi:hypothetical protein
MYLVPARAARFTTRFLATIGQIGAVALMVAVATPVSAHEKTPTPSKNHPCLTAITPTPTPSPTPSPTATETPEIASPIAGSPEVGRPAATPVSTVAPTAAPRGYPVAAVEAEIAALQKTIAACASKGDYSALSQLVTGHYLAGVYAAGQALTREQFVDQIAPYLPTTPVRVKAIDNVRLTDDGATAEVTTVVGNQLVRFKSTYVEDDDADGTGLRWLLDDETAIDVPRPKGADIVQIRIDDGSFHLQEQSARSPDVVLKGTNRGDATHEMLVVRLGKGVSTETLLDNPGPQFPKGVTYIGQVTVAPGATDELVLVDLRPGNYAIVCLLYDQDGNPYLASGMKAKLVVT